MDSLRYYVYALVDPRNDEVFYVGKGCVNRITHHYRENSLKKSCRKSNIIKLYRQLGYLDQSFFIINNISEDEAKFQEIFWISYFGRHDLGQGYLANNTFGGDSCPSQFLSPSAKAKAAGKHWFKDDGPLQKLNREGKTRPRVIIGGHPKFPTR